jgi:putative membrane protein
MRILGFLILNSLALMITAFIVPGVAFEGYMSLLVAAVVIGILNTFIKPIVQILTLPITFVTLGLFALVLNAAFFLIAAQLTPGFTVDGFLPALIGSLVLSLVSTFLGMLK